MSARLSMRAAINAMCRQCIHDPLSRGTWREQVGQCSSSNCPLYPLRPMPIGHKSGEATNDAPGPEDLAGKAQSQ
jgi:hypothetical protein